MVYILSLLLPGHSAAEHQFNLLTYQDINKIKYKCDLFKPIFGATNLIMLLLKFLKALLFMFSKGMGQNLMQAKKLINEKLKDK